MKEGWGRLNREEKLIIALLNEQYEEADKLITGKKPFLWELFFDLISYHRIMPSLLDRLLTKMTADLPEHVIKQARLFILQQKTVNKMHRQEFIKAARILGEAGFDVQLMKGLSYDPEEKSCRTYGDVDLLVEEERIREIIPLLEGKGYVYKGSFILSREEKTDIEGQLSWNNQYQFNCPDAPQSIEVHTNLFERDRIRLENLNHLLDRPDLFRRGRQWNDELHCYIPGREASLMLLCLHCSLKRALYNDLFILRHMTDMDILFAGGIEGILFSTLCRESETVYHAVFSLSLYALIREKSLPPWFDALRGELSRKELTQVKRHLSCLKNLRGGRSGRRIVYNLTAPFVIGGSAKQRYTWIRNMILPTKVEQENRYYRWGFKKESPLIYLTYLINPFQTGWRIIKTILGIKDRPFPNSDEDQ